VSYVPSAAGAGKFGTGCKTNGKTASPAGLYSEVHDDNDRHEFTTHLEVDEFHCEPSLPSDPTGAITAASVTITGFLVPVELVSLDGNVDYARHDFFGFP